MNIKGMKDIVQLTGMYHVSCNHFVFQPWKDVNKSACEQYGCI